MAKKDEPLNEESATKVLLEMWDSGNLCVTGGPYEFTLSADGVNATLNMVHQGSVLTLPEYELEGTINEREVQIRAAFKELVFELNNPT